MSAKLTIVLALLSLILPFVTAAHWGRRHQEVALRARGDVDIHKRQGYFNARFTFYDVGLGACGQYNVASDWIVALNVEQYGSGYPGPMCFKSITIQYGGKTAQAVIVDECMGCPYAALDFSRGLFDFFASESVGVIYGSWYLNDDSGQGGSQSTSTWAPPPATTWEPPTTTSTPAYTPPATSSTPAYTPPITSSTPSYIPSPTTSTVSTTSAYSTTSTFSNNFNATSVGGLAVPTTVMSTPGPSNPQNILNMNNVLVEVGIMLSIAL